MNERKNTKLGKKRQIICMTNTEQKRALYIQHTTTKKTYIQGTHSRKLILAVLAKA